MTEVERLNEENDNLRVSLRNMEIKYHQAMGALGYPVPGNIPESDLKCGLCQIHLKEVNEKSVKIRTLWDVIKLHIQERN